jgi:hypothetical protein
MPIIIETIKGRLPMEANMLIPLWIKILVLTLSALAVFTLAARELVAAWLMSAVKLFLFRPKRAARGTSKQEIKLGEPSVARPV